MNKTDKFFSSTIMTFQWEKSDKHTNKPRKRINKECKRVMSVLKKIKQGVMMEMRARKRGYFR